MAKDFSPAPEITPSDGSVAELNKEEVKVDQVESKENQESVLIVEGSVQIIENNGIG